MAIRRRETVAVAPEVFADFLLRRQHLRGTALAVEGTEGLERVLDQLRGLAAPASFWENEILPRRVKGYRPAWLDQLLAEGSWLWRAARDGGTSPPSRWCLASSPAAGPAASDAEEPSADARQVLEILTIRGASFATDLARETGLEPSRLRRALRELMERGLVTNDRFDPVAPGACAMLDALAEASESRMLGRSRRVRRRVHPGHPEGRWSRLEPPPEDAEAQRLAWIDALLDRYGVLTRELLALDPWAPPWAELAPLLARAELRGELRRGYFVEGFSGVQYALEEAAWELLRLSGPAHRGAGDVLAAGRRSGEPLRQRGSARYSAAGRRDGPAEPGMPAITW